MHSQAIELLATFYKVKIYLLKGSFKKLVKTFIVF